MKRNIKIFQKYLIYFIIFIFSFFEPIIWPFSEFVLAVDNNTYDPQACQYYIDNPEIPVPDEIDCYDVIVESNIDVDNRTQKEKDIDSAFSIMNSAAKDTRKLYSFMDSSYGSLIVNPYDLGELIKWQTIYQNLKTNPDRYSAYEKTGTVPQETLDDLQISELPQNYDPRTLESIINLVTPIENNGAGMERLTVSRLVQGYSSRLTGTTFKEVPPESKDAEPDADTYLSPHYYGEAADVTETDYLRGTAFIYECEEGGGCSLKEKRKLDKKPISVSWQTDTQAGTPGAMPSIAGMSMNDLFKNIFNGTLTNYFVNALSQKGTDITMSDLKADNAGQLLLKLAGNWMKTQYNLPANASIGVSLGQTGQSITQANLATNSNQLLPQEGWAGENSYELLTNLGRTYIEKNAALPAGSLRGKSSAEVITSVGRRKIEAELDLPDGSLTGVGGGDDINLKVGQAYIEKSLQIETGGFSGNSISEFKTNLKGKYDDLMENTARTDNILGVAVGTIDTIKNASDGNISGLISNLKKSVGAKLIESKITSVYHKDKINDALGLEAGTPATVSTLSTMGTTGAYNIPGVTSVAAVPGSWEKFLATGSAEFYNIGIYVLSNSMSINENITNPEARNNIKNWLSTGVIPQDLTTNPPTSLINEEVLANNWKLQKGDIERIFGKDRSQAEAVYYRIGKINYYLALAGSTTEIANNSASVSSIDFDGFYKPRITNIKNEILKLKNNTSDQNIKNLAVEIEANIADIENYTATNTLRNVIIKDKVDYTKEKVNSIQQKIVAIESIKKTENSESIRNYIDEIIEGKEIKDPKSITADNMKNLSNSLYGSTNISTELVGVMNDRTTINDFLVKTGLNLLGESLELKTPGALYTAWKTIEGSKNYVNAIQIITNSIGNSDLTKVTNILNSSIFNLGYNNNNYYLNASDFPKLLLGSIVQNFKVGAPIANTALNMYPGKGLGEYLENKVSWDDVEKGGALKNMYDFSSLFRLPKFEGDVWKNFMQGFLEEKLGLVAGTFDAGNSLEKMVEKNGIGRFLLAFGIQVPQNVLNNQTALLDFYKKVKAGDPEVWSDPKTWQTIAQTAGVYGVDWQGVKKIFTGDATGETIYGVVDSILKNKIISVDSNTQYAIDGFFELYKIFSADSKDENDTIGDYSVKNDLDALKQRQNEIPEKVLKVFAKVFKNSIDSKLGFQLDNALSFYDYMKDAVKGKKMQLTNGISLLSRIFNNKGLDIFNDFQNKLVGLNVILTKAGLQPIDINGIVIDWSEIKSGRDIFDLIYNKGLKDIKIHDLANNYITATAIDYLRASGIPITVSGNSITSGYSVSATFDLLGVNTVVNARFNSFFDVVKDFTHIERFDDVLRSAVGDLKGFLVTWGIAYAQKQYTDLANKLGIPSSIDFNSLRKAYFSPTGEEWKNYQIQAEAYLQSNYANWNNLSPEDKNIAIKNKKNELANTAMKEAQKNVQFIMYDTLVFKAFDATGNIKFAPGTGFSKTMFEGSAEDKMTFLRDYFKRLISQNIRDDSGLVELLVNSPLGDCLGGICPSNTDITKWLDTNGYQAIDAKIRQLTGWTFLPEGFTKSFTAYVKTGDFNGTIGQTFSLKNLLADNYAKFAITNWFDKTLNLPMGSTYQVWQSYETYKQAVITLENAKTAFVNLQSTGDAVKDWVNSTWANKQIISAETSMLQAKANMIILAVNVAFGKFFAQLDQYMGLPPGTTAMVISVVLYSVIVGTTLAGALTGLFGGPVGVILALASLLFGSSIFGGGEKKKYGKVEVYYTACGYYPGYKQEVTGWDETIIDEYKSDGTVKESHVVHHEGIDDALKKAKETNNELDWKHYRDILTQYDAIASQNITVGCPGEFLGTDNTQFKKGLRPASEYKIKNLLYNLLTLDERTGKEELLPTRVETFDKSDILSPRVSEKRDEKFGDGSIGSADQRIKEDNRSNLFANKLMTNYIHWSY